MSPVTGARWRMWEHDQPQQSARDHDTVSMLRRSDSRGVDPRESGRSHFRAILDGGVAFENIPFWFE